MLGLAALELVAVVNAAWVVSDQSLPIPLGQHGVALIRSDNDSDAICTFGGLTNDVNGDAKLVSRAWCLQQNSSRWEPRSTHSFVPRSGLAACGISGGAVVMGGLQGNNSRPTSLVQRYTAVNDSWSSLPPMPTARNGLRAISVTDDSGMNAVLAVGGYHEGLGDGHLATVEALFVQPGHSHWVTLPAMNVPRSGFGIAAFGMLVFVAGGASINHSLTTSVEMFDFASRKSWVKCQSSLVRERSYLGMALFSPQSQLPRSHQMQTEKLEVQLLAFGGTNCSKHHTEIVNGTWRCESMPTSELATMSIEADHSVTLSQFSLIDAKMPVPVHAEGWFIQQEPHAVCTVGGETDSNVYTRLLQCFGLFARPSSR